MKKMLFILVCVALTATACQKGKYTIKGTVDDPSLNGVYAILQTHLPNGYVEIDSCLVCDGKFTFMGEVDGNATADIVFRDDREESPYIFFFVLEPGTIHVDHFHKYDMDVTLGGTPLNDALNAYIQACEADTISMTPQESARLDTLIKVMNSELKLPIEVQKRYENWYDSLTHPRNERRIQRLWDLYHQNEHNILACYALEQLDGFCEDFQRFAFVDSLLRTADTLVVKKFSYKLPYLKAMDNTAEGKQYADIPGTVTVYSEKENKWIESKGSLKDIIDGKLAVIDFWASWCGPCRQEIRTNLVPLHKKYKDSGLLVVGIDVRDEVEDFYRAVADEHIKYPQLFVDSVNAAQIYGFEGIPEIILIAPDGTILARDLRGEYVEEAVLKALKK